MGLYKRGKVWWIDYFPPGKQGKRIRESVGPVKDEARTTATDGFGPRQT